ncbi:hypothetical protein DFJ58DRAFT_767637, partial [Suillus subalutaceus]|uniref:uncharacterized protein n=1 Tax=Suillus subalutaceus TaxID=48586 RepID=UPI001B875780
PWLVASFIVLMMSATADCGTTLSAINRCSDPDETATTFAFLVAHPASPREHRTLDEEDHLTVRYLWVNDEESGAHLNGITHQRPMRLSLALERT